MPRELWFEAGNVYVANVPQFQSLEADSLLA
jgi:hypothetical protein